MNAVLDKRGIPGAENTGAREFSSSKCKDIFYEKLLCLLVKHMSHFLYWQQIIAQGAE